MNLRQKVSKIRIRLTNFGKDRGRVTNYVVEEIIEKPPVEFPESKNLFSEDKDLEWQHLQERLL